MKKNINMFRNVALGMTFVLSLAVLSPSIAKANWADDNCSASGVDASPVAIPVTLATNDNLNINFDGQPHYISFTITRTDTNTQLDPSAYLGEYPSGPFTAPGTYPIHAQSNCYNYVGSTDVTLVITDPNASTTPTFGGDTSGTSGNASSTTGGDSSTNPNQNGTPSFGGDSSTNPNQNGTPSFGGDSSTNPNQNNGSSTNSFAPTIQSVSDISTTTTGTDLIVNYTLPTAFDTHDGSLTPVCTPASGSDFALGTTTVTCVATNSANLSASTTFNVIVTATTSSTTPIDNGGGSTPTDNTGGGSGSTLTGGGSGGGGGATNFVVTDAATAPITPNECPFLTGFVIPGRNSLPSDIAKVQVFLNTYDHASLPVNGILDGATENAIITFQSENLSDIMGPWGSNTPSGQVYITTQKEINAIVCNSPKSLSDADLAIINAYKAGQTQNNGSTPATVGTTTTDINGNPVIGSTTASTSPATTTLNNSQLVGNSFTSAGGFFKTLFAKIKGWF